MALSRPRLHKAFVVTQLPSSDVQIAPGEPRSSSPSPSVLRLRASGFDKRHGRLAAAVTGPGTSSCCSVSPPVALALLTLQKEHKRAASDRRADRSGGLPFAAACFAVAARPPRARSSCRCDRDALRQPTLRTSPCAGAGSWTCTSFRRLPASDRLNCSARSGCADARHAGRTSPRVRLFLSHYRVVYINADGERGSRPSPLVNLPGLARLAAGSLGWDGVVEVGWNDGVAAVRSAAPTPRSWPLCWLPLSHDRADAALLGPCLGRDLAANRPRLSRPRPRRAAARTRTKFVPPPAAGRI